MSARALVIAGAAVALVSLAGFTKVRADEPKTHMEHHEVTIDHMVEVAHTPADHEAIAKRFEEEAADLDKLASTHETLAKRYHAGSGAGPKTNTAGLASHCDGFVKNLRASAQEAREMARMHREMAHEVAK